MKQFVLDLSKEKNMLPGRIWFWIWFFFKWV